MKGLRKPGDCGRCSAFRRNDATIVTTVQCTLEYARFRNADDTIGTFAAENHIMPVRLIDFL